MSLSPSLRRALGDNSGYVRGQLGQSSVKTQISNAKSRLSAVGVDPEEGKNNQNFLLKTLDILARPGYAGANMLREFTSQNKGAGETPDTFDPFAAFARGLTGKEKTTGKDIFTDQGMSGDTGIFGGEAKWYNPSAAGALGLALDIFNPIDVTNWIGFGVGDDIIKGTSRGTRALTDAFGATKAAQISDLLMSSAKSVDDVTDAVRTSGKALNASKTLDDLGADTVGNLIRQISGKVDSVDKVQQLNNLISEGLLETGKNAATKLDYRALKPLSIGLQNPLSITPIGSVKLPGYKATKGAAKLPLVAPGRDFAGTFVNIPGSEYLTNAISKVTQKVAESSVGQALGKMFSTAFVPNTVPSSVVMRNMTINNLDDLVDIAKTVPDNVPLSVDELMTLRDELAQVTVSNTFDFADNFSASQLKQVNKGNYFSVQELAKRVKLKNFSTDEILSVLNDAPFTKTIPELYDSLRTMKPQTDAKNLFNGAAKLRKVMDLMYEQIPEGAKPFFTGVLKSQLSDLYPSEITSKRLGKNLSSSPLMAYEFNYKGVPISVVVNSGEDFNLDPWAKLSSTFEAMDELPEESIQALKAQVDISPVPIKNPDTSMTIGNTVVLGRIDKPTVAHEFGHLWDSVAGDPESYSKAILSDSQKIDNTITPDDLYSDYARSLYSTNNTIGLKEDFADSISDYLKDRKMFSQSYPGRTSEIERILSQTSVPKEELAKMVSKQRAIAEQVSQIPRAEEQIRQMLDSVDQYSRKIATLSGDKAYQSFKQSLSALYEQTNWKTKQWQQQVDELFRGIGKEERKQIMDAAAQITGTEIPGRAKSMAQPMFADMASQDSTLKFNQITRAWKESWTPYYEVRQRLLRQGELDINPQRTYRGAEPGRYQVPTDNKAPKYPKHIFEVVDRKTGEVVTSVASYTNSPPTQTAAMIKAFERNPELATKYGIEPQPKLKPLSSNSFSEPLFAQQNFPVFMSKLEEATGKMSNSMPVDQFKAYLKAQGVKDEEMKWTFLDELLDGKTKVSKAEVQDWVKGNKIEVQEVWKSGSPRSSSDTLQIAMDDAGTSWDGVRSDILTFISEGQSRRSITDDLAEALELSMEDAKFLVDNADKPNLFNTFFDATKGDTKFSQYTQPNGEGYTELIFTLPNDYNAPKFGTMKAEKPGTQMYRIENNETGEVVEASLPGIQDFLGRYTPENELWTDPVPVDGSYSPSFSAPYHWEETNPVAHTRFDTRYTEDGRKILFIDEIQSDWHQHGRDDGYLTLGMDREDTYRQERDKLAKLRSNYYDESQYTELNWSERMHKIGEIDEQIRGLESNIEDRVADAPFKTNWDEFVQKRLLRYAADNGYDGIAWSTGKQQAERWSQSIIDSIDTVQYNPEGKTLRAYKNGEQVIYQKVEPDELPRLVGSDVAKKLLDTTPDTYTIKPVDSPSSYDLYEQKALQDTEGMDLVAMSRYLDKNQFDGGNRGFKVYDQNGNAWSYVYPTERDAQKAIENLATVGETMKTVSGTNITVGGEGMRKFYDQQVPSNFKKLGKKFGLTVEELQVPMGAREVVPSIEGPSPVRYFFTGEGNGNISNSEDFIRFNMEEMEDVSPLQVLEYTDTSLRFPSTEDVDNLVDTARRISLEEGMATPDDLFEAARNRLYQQVRDPGPLQFLDEAGDGTPLHYRETPPKLNTQQGIWLSPESRTKITQQSFPLFADNTKAPVDNLTQGWSERQITALDNFLKWRNSVVKQYRQIGIPINELEKYVPFIPERVLNKKEAEVLRNTLGTGVKDAGVDNFDTFMAGITRADPNLKKRTTGATRPSEVNKILKKNWLTEDAAIAMNIRGQRAIKAQELNTFVDEFVDTYGLRASDLAELAGNTVPDGYNAYRVGIDSTGNKVLEMVNNVPKDVVKGTEVVFLPDEMAKLYNEYQGLMLNKGKKNGLLRVYDSLSSLYKKASYLWNPGHIMRDFQGNVFNNYLMGVVDPAEYAEGLKAFRKAEGVLQTPKGDIEYSKIYEQAQKLGIVDSVMAHELPLTNVKPEGGYSKLMRSATYATDGWTRMTGFIHNLKQGQSFAEAATTTKKYLFDYFDLTPFERKVMRRIIPFYTFMRKNIPLQFKTLVTDPRIFARIGKIQNAIAGGPIDWEDKPEYIQDTGAIQPLGSDFYVGNTLPFQDLAKIPMGLDMDAMGGFLSSVNPLIRAPIESITNQDWWTGEKLEDYAGEQSDIPVLSSLLRALGSNDNLTVSSRTTGNLLDNIPVLSRADDLLNIATGQETNDSRILSRVSTTMGGPSVYGASSVERSADWQERQRLLDLIRLLQDQGVEIPNASQLKQDSRYGRLKRILGGK